MQSVYLSFKLVFYISKFLGTIPLKFVKIPSHHFIQTWHCTFISSVYILLSIFHIILTPCFISGESITSSTLVHVDFPGGNVSEYVSFIRNQTNVQMVAMRMLNPLIVSSMSLGAQIVSIFFVKNDLPHFFNKLSQADISLNTVVIGKGGIDSKITVYVVLYFIVLSLPIALVYLSFSITAILDWEFIWNFVLTSENFISFSCEIQFIVLALFLHRRFKIVNDYLLGHIEKPISVNYFFVFKNILPCKSQLTLQKIEILHYSHNKLCELMKDLNAIYKFQLLCTSAGCFIKVLFNLYYAMFGQWFSSLSNLFKLAKILLWTMYYLVRFLVTTITASLTSKEVMKTKGFIAHINSRRLSKEIQEELNYFTNHISCMEMKFTACGLITINTRLITAALATGTTYLVVLLQFRPQV